MTDKEWGDAMREWKDKVKTIREEIRKMNEKAKLIDAAKSFGSIESLERNRGELSLLLNVYVDLETKHTIILNHPIRYPTTARKITDSISEMIKRLGDELSEVERKINIIRSILPEDGLMISNNLLELNNVLRDLQSKEPIYSYLVRDPSYDDVRECRCNPDWGCLCNNSRLPSSSYERWND